MKSKGQSPESPRGPGTETGASPGDAILEARGIRRLFGGIVAVDVERFAVRRGRVTSLIGPNGAGKTTLFNVLTGFDSPSAGSWTLNGRPVRGLPPHRLVSLGMVRTFQLTKTLRRTTVLDNMKLAAQHQRGERLRAVLIRRNWTSQERAIERRALELLGRFELGHLAARYAGELSGGQQRLLDLARALMTDPQLILLDEPMAGINPILVAGIRDHIAELRASGLSVLLIEHDMDLVMSVSDHVICMAQGAIIAEGTPDEIAANEDVVEAYLGREDDDPTPETTPTQRHARAAGP